MEKKKILFVCNHNSGRSQMAEAYLKLFGSDNYKVESAGISPGTLNPHVVKVMQEDGIDISQNRTKSVFTFFQEGRLFSYVITVCDRETAEKCPIFPGHGKRLHWSFQDPSALTGTEEEILAGTRTIRDEIKKKINEFVRQDIS